MNKLKLFVKKGFIKYGSIVAACAFAFVSLAANSSCFIPYYERGDPKALDTYKKFDKYSPV